MMNYWRGFSILCCCCRKKNCCTCCKNDQPINDKLFIKGRAKLHAEIDLLQIIKQLRVNSFVSSTILKPHQDMLIKWFDQFKIKVKPEELASDLV